MFYFADSRGSTFYIFLYIVCLAHDVSPCLSFTSVCIHHSYSVTPPSLGVRLFFILLEINNNPAIASTSGRLHCECVRLLFLQAHRKLTAFLQLQEFSLCNPTVASSTTATSRDDDFMGTIWVSSIDRRLFSVYFAWGRQGHISTLMC